MSSETSFAGKTVVVTRPLAQVQNMLELLEARLAKVVHFPVISICAAKDMSIPKQYLSHLADYKFIIFISANAVHYAINTAQEMGINFNGLSLATVGPATKAALENYGYKVSITPLTGFNSEALLNDPALQKIEQQKILIIRGEGGREHLRKTLESRGAQVEYAEVYQRQLPTTRNPIDLSNLSKANTAVLLYSVESAQNLWSLCTADEQQWLKNITLITASQRIANAATRVGLANDPIIAENPNDQAMLKALNSWSITACS
jgi:uroporphyrinogen-III synthase